MANTSAALCQRAAWCKGLVWQPAQPPTTVFTQCEFTCPFPQIPASLLLSFGVLNMSVKCSEYDVCIFFIFYFFSTHFIVCLLWSQIAGLNIFAMFPCAEGRIHEAVIFTWCCFFGKYKLVKQIYGLLIFKLSLSNFLLCCRTGRSHQWEQMQAFHSVFIFQNNWCWLIQSTTSLSCIYHTFPVLFQLFLHLVIDNLKKERTWHHLCWLHSFSLYFFCGVCKFSSWSCELPVGADMWVRWTGKL